ncbi:Undecaprenyl pyrophosphate synthetase [Rubritalea squalenifaciens DSM 18772]|uniref:Isoprenyl transferase n=1 Tax=Rubritalea squalenifaciens DSM 18772 TaxID=1123071 RepID=A0A1M6L8Y7_9BACT|nr:isoprenyl transferase [Rubritalea squalenifaciens]SHJ67671.1 Undecaprenyl pyrophosphate synthetase [Rubritalea squalenifaciens DSM 18772]
MSQTKSMPTDSSIQVTPSPLQVPEHVAIIMDGNGRWANQRGLPRAAGHRAGAESVRRAVEACKRYHIKYLTLYAFSSENWKRPESEIKALMSLLQRFLKEKTKEMVKQNVRLRTIGRIDMLPEDTRKQLDKALKQTENNTELTVTLALSYGSREEIVDATKAIAKDVAGGKLDPDTIDNATFKNYLYAPDQPDPDLLIRTSGELRLSNFLLWQLSYAEIFVLDKFWPDFNEEDMHAAVQEYSKRHRRFGAI